MLYQDPRVVEVSSNTISAHSAIGESQHLETLSQPYWTIMTNERGEFRTSLERDNTVDARDFIGTVYLMPTESDASLTPSHSNSKEMEAYTHPTEIETRRSDSVECEGYINPIPSDPKISDEHFEPGCLHSVVK
ncbi:hypothetical protein CHS0354_025619 [Potamilus streckersoni]|uniref:Uncharacterized protein n=1 Tax=Potamilus streckersoni TaxID=2493646 RepID=A0AAE0VMV6_9BIVA|nr:hypothetical protein CHS0354_025619 [Potamilus streckersoni]